MKQHLITALVLTGCLGLSALPAIAAPKAVTSHAVPIRFFTPPPLPPSPPPLDADTQAALTALREQTLILINDFNEMSDMTEVTEEMLQTIYDDLVVVLDEATLPDQTLVEALFLDLSDAMEDGTVSNIEKLRLMQSIIAVLNSANLDQTEVETLLKAVQSLLITMDIDPSDAQVIVHDLKLIVEDLQALADSVQS